MNVITHPKFKDCYNVEIIEPHNVFLLTEDNYKVFSGRPYAAIAPYLIDGQHTATELTTLLEGELSPPEVYYVLNEMEAKGILMEGRTAIKPEIAAFWQSLGIDAQEATDRIQQSRIDIHAIGTADTEPLRAALQRMHVQVGEYGTFSVVVVDDYLQAGLDVFNEQALAAKLPWILLKLVGHTIWLGPIFIPDQTACWACLAQRIRANRQLESYILDKIGQPGPLRKQPAVLSTTVAIGANWAATEIVKWIGQGRNQLLEGKLITWDSLLTNTQTHVVVRRPQCPVCGDPAYYRKSRRLQLSSCGKQSTEADGSRAALPDETFAHYKHHISPITGVVTWLIDTTEEHNGLVYTYSAGHSFTMVQDNLHWLQQNLRSRTGGKGVTTIQAKVSAMGEAIERYSGVYRGEEQTVRTSYTALAPQAIHLHDCLNFSASQYANRHAWNAQLTGGHHQVVPIPFDEAQVMDWSPLWSLTHNEFKYVPTAFCYYGHPESTQLFFCAGDSNGTAAGNTLEEAILRGYLEVVERDCVALWWYNRVQRPKVDLESFNLPYLRKLYAYYQSLNREFWVIDITNDLQIPCFAAISRRMDNAVEDIVLGFAAHLHPQTACLRAVTEMNQFLPAVSHKDLNGNTLYNFPDEEAIEWWKTATIANQPYLVPDSVANEKGYRDYHQLERDDLLTDIETCIHIAQEVGLEVLVLDQTRPDIGMCVCKVVVPGMRHFWRRLGPGRLYDVPVQLGWLEEPLAEEDLNPYSIFF